MAKQIKTIQCPQCGSAQQSNIKEDHYKCGSCGAEYFLDNDDINVNIRYQTEPPKQVNTNNKVAIIASITISVIITLMIFVNNINKSSSSSHGVYSSGTPSIKTVAQKKYKESIKTSVLSNTGSTILFYLTDRKYDRADTDDKNGLYAVFYDYMKKKIVKEEKLDEDVKRGGSLEQTFLPASKRYYIIANGRKIMDLNFDKFTFRDVTTELLAEHTEFSSGIASAKFIYAERGEGFVLISNMGKEFYFVPSLNKLYKKDDFYEAGANGMRGVMPNAINKTYYTFTKTSYDYPEADIQLLKIIYKYNNGGPEDKESSPSWRKQYPYSGIIYDNTPFKKILIDKDRARVTAFEDITPGRHYFSASVEYQGDESSLLISFKPTIAPDEKTQLQLLNLNTKEPIWTVTIDNGLGRSEAVKTDKYYVFSVRNDKLFKIDHNGQNSEYIEIETERPY